jgi:hypothetical protein
LIVDRFAPFVDTDVSQLCSHIDTTRREIGLNSVNGSIECLYRLRRSPRRIVYTKVATFSTVEEENGKIYCVDQT